MADPEGLHPAGVYGSSGVVFSVGFSGSLSRLFWIQVPNSIFLYTSAVRATPEYRARFLVEHPHPLTTDGLVLFSAGVTGVA